MFVRTVTITILVEAISVPSVKKMLVKNKNKKVA